MIRGPRPEGVAFTEGSDGDMADAAARKAVSEQLGIDPLWASVAQVHGANVLRVDQGGKHGEADAVWTSEPGLPVAILTADCFGVVLVADGAVGVAHGGWRGLQGGVVGKLRVQMDDAGFSPAFAAVGPGIGACCFEVGTEVARLFDGHTATTAWGAESVNLAGVVEEQLVGIEKWFVDSCTYSDEGWFSHRRDRSKERLAALAWRS